MFFQRQPETSQGPVTTISIIVMFLCMKVLRFMLSFYIPEIIGVQSFPHLFRFFYHYAVIPERQFRYITSVWC
jgi:hypothetical protein